MCKSIGSIPSTAKEKKEEENEVEEKRGRGEQRTQYNPHVCSPVNLLAHLGKCLPCYTNQVNTWW
jgi:hypothetical protein